MSHEHSDPHRPSPDQNPRARTVWSWLRAQWQLGLVAIAGVALAIGFFGEHFFALSPNVTLACYLIAYVAAGYDISRHALPALFRGQFDTDILMLAAAAGAAALGQWAEGAFLLFLFALGHAGEHYALDRARHAVQALGQLMPQSAHVKREGRIIETPVDELAIGEIVVVRPGDRVPVDGTITSGESTLDQAAITGESAPVDLRPGDSVFAGTINRENALDIRIDKLARDNTLARVMQLVEAAEQQRSPTQLFTARFTRRFVPIVLLATGLMIVLPPLLFSWSWSESFYRGMLLLVAASPCALAIGTPAAVLAGIAQAARRGVLIKGGVHLENLGRIRVIALDKTGTLTSGKFRVTQVVPFGDITESELLSVAAAVEEQSNHPLAAAIAAETRTRNLAFPSATDMENLAGRGLRANVEGTPVLIGALRAFHDDPTATEGSAVASTVAQLEAAGQTTVIVRRAGIFLGVIALADAPRAAAVASLAQLKQLGIEHLVMLTGDNAAVARRVADQVGVTEFRAGLLPEDKVAAIRELHANYGPIAMIGDGVNDAPALATATVGIAMGQAGTAVALETADVALIGDDLEKLSFAVGLSRASERIIRQNIFIALGVIGVLLIASLSGSIVLSIAVIVHEGSTLVVVFNALRLLGWKSRPIPTSSHA